MQSACVFGFKSFKMESTERFVFVITSNNRMVSSVSTDRILHRELIGLIESKNPLLKNMVFQNGVVIFAFEHEGMINFRMHTDIQITDPNRFINPDTFNSLNLRAHVPSGFQKGTVYVLIRHGQAWHNKPEAECDEFLRENPEIVAQMLELAQKRDSKIECVRIDDEQKLKLALKTLRQDAALTPQGEEEALLTAKKLKTFFESTFLVVPPITFLSSELQRTQETAAIIASHLGHTSPIYACAALNEINREMNSTYWSLDHQSRDVAESMVESMYKYVTSILKDPPQISESDWKKASSEYREPFETRVRSILAENKPCLDGPSSFCGLPIVHRACALPFDGDLIKDLPRISNILHFCSGNKRKLLDIQAVFGKFLVMVPFKGDEVQGKPLYVAEVKAKKMHDDLGAPVLTEDVALGKWGRDSAADALIKYHVEEAAEENVSLKMKLEERFGGAIYCNYQSTCVFTNGTRTIKTLSKARCTLKELTEEETKGVVGNIDPYVVVREIQTFRQINDSEPEPVGSIAFDASEGLSIGQWQARDAGNRSKLHPRYYALYEMRQLLSKHGVMW
jgi:hypothetical protein